MLSYTSLAWERNDTSMRLRQKEGQRTLDFNSVIKIIQY